MDQLICASLSHTHYWYEVGMLKIPYGGNFSAVGGLSFFGGNDFGGGGKNKIWR